MTVSVTDMPSHPADALGPEEFVRLVEWIRAPGRKPAFLAFTAGALRDAAYAMEHSGLFDATRRAALALEPGRCPHCRNALAALGEFAPQR